MGWRPPPPPPEFGGPCELCFPAAQTPKRMIASFSGIEPCHGAIPPVYGSIPSSVLITNAGGCEWGGWAGVSWYCLYRTGLWGSSLWLAADDGAAVFDGFSATPCTYGFRNRADCLFPATYIASGGAGSLIWRANIYPSVADVCELVGFPNDLNTKFDCTPIDETHNLFHFYRKGWTRDMLFNIDMNAL